MHLFSGDTSESESRHQIQARLDWKYRVTSSVEGTLKQLTGKNPPVLTDTKYTCSFSKRWALVEICQRLNTCMLLKHTTQATPVQVSKTVPGTVAERALLVGGYQSSRINSPSCNYM